MAENKTAGHNFEVIKKLCDQLHSGEAERNDCYGQFEAPFGGLHKPPYPDNYFIHVQFDAVKDVALRTKVSKIGTSLQLPKADIDLLQKTAGELLMQSPAFQKLMKDLSATVAADKPKHVS